MQNNILIKILRFLGKIMSGTKKIAGKKNTIKNCGILSNVRYDIVGDENSVYISKGSTISDTHIYIRGSNNRLVIGQNVEYSGGALWFEGDNCLIDIGKNTTVLSACLQVIESNRKIVIGSDCMFSVNITVWTSDFHSIVELQSHRRINPSKDVIVGNHVWVGADALLLKGVSLRDNSIVAARSVVTKSVLENTIVAGSPARCIRTGINWERDRNI